MPRDWRKRQRGLVGYLWALKFSNVRWFSFEGLGIRNASYVANRLRYGDNKNEDIFTRENNFPFCELSKLIYSIMPTLVATCYIEIGSLNKENLSHHAGVQSCLFCNHQRKSPSLSQMHGRQSAESKDSK